LEILPDAHDTQVRIAASEYLPGIHCMQSFIASNQYSPAAHPEHTEEELDENVPAAQSLHVETEVAPVALENWSAAQLTHLGTKTSNLPYLPVLQGLHPLPAPVEVCPSSHGEHSLSIFFWNPSRHSTHEGIS